MRVLLDTHVLLWAVSDSKQLPKSSLKLIEDSDVYVSAASIWEVSIKAALGKLKVTPATLLASLDPAGFSLLSITAEHAAAVYSLPGLHRDPFDRLLVTQAQLEAMTLLTTDRALCAYGQSVRLI